MQTSSLSIVTQHASKRDHLPVSYSAREKRAWKRLGEENSSSVYETPVIVRVQDKAQISDQRNFCPTRIDRGDDCELSDMLPVLAASHLTNVRGLDGWRRGVQSIVQYNTVHVRRLSRTLFLLNFKWLAAVAHIMRHEGSVVFALPVALTKRHPCARAVRPWAQQYKGGVVDRTEIARVQGVARRASLMPMSESATV